MRTAWTPNFPDVVIHTQLDLRDGHPGYAAAKAGNADAADQLVQALLSDQALVTLSDLVGQRAVFLASVSAIEDTGFNAIPDAMTNGISLRLGWEFDPGEIRQVNKVAHTRADGWHRLTTQASFAGNVQPGGQYVLVDDHIGFGGTLANMRGYIESAGGQVVAMTTLTETVGARRIALQETTLEQLRAKHGSELEDIWQRTFGYGLELCTELEAGYLHRYRSVDFIGRCLAKAAKKANQRSLSTVGPFENR